MKNDRRSKFLHLFESLNGVKVDQQKVKTLLKEGLENLNQTTINPNKADGIFDDPYAQEPNISVNPDGAGNPNPSLPETTVYETELDKLNNYVNKEVRFLKAGDELYSSGAKIITSPTSGLNTPTGKVEIEVEYPNGRRKVQLWGKYTIVAIKPQPKGMGINEKKTVDPISNPLLAEELKRMNELAGIKMDEEKPEIK